MDAVFSALGGLMMKALPTFILLILLHFYLKWAFYSPLDRLLHRRWEATEGARKLAGETLEDAQRKADAYEEAIRNSRSAIHKGQEQMRRQWQQEQAAAVEQARQSARSMVIQAKEELAAETEAARLGLQAESETLAEQIAGAVLDLERRAA